MGEQVGRVIVVVLWFAVFIFAVQLIAEKTAQPTTTSCNTLFPVSQVRHLELPESVGFCVYFDRSVQSISRPQVVLFLGNPEQSITENAAILNDLSFGEKHKTYLAFPLDPAPSPTDMPELVLALRQELSVNEAQLYLAGFGKSAGALFQLVCSAPIHFHGLLTVGATMPNELLERCAPAQPVSVVLVHGTTDRQFPFHGGGVTTQNEKAEMSSAFDTLEYWRRFNGCQSEAPKRFVSHVGPENGTRVLYERWIECSENVETGLYTIIGGKHHWPKGPSITAPSGKGVNNDISAGAEFARIISSRVEVVSKLKVQGN